MASQPISLPIKPGVDTVSTPFQSLGQISESNLIRFLNGQIEKLGGCVSIVGSHFSGQATALLPFCDLADIKYVAIGSNPNLELFSSGAVTNITPTTGTHGLGDWSLDRFGEILVGAAGKSSVYQWVPPISPGNIATVVPNSPALVNGLVVAAPQQQIVTWGATSISLGAQDPMLVKWCDVADLTDWTAAVNNQAGSFRIPHGCEILNIMWPGLSGLLWTDIDLWAITYVNFPLVYGFNNIAQNCGLISRRAVAQLGQRIAWMSQKSFYIYQGGTVQALNCTVYDFVFGDNGLDRTQLTQVHADSNSYYNEITWRFPRAGFVGGSAAYVKATWIGNEVLWDYGETGPIISAWTDESVVGSPIGANTAPNLLSFEQGIDYDGDPHNSGFLSGWFYLQESHVNVFLERIRPDFSINPGGQIQLSVIFADEIPQEDDDYPVRTYGPYPVTAKTPFVIIRGSGTAARIRIECTTPNTFWRYGKPIANVSIDGHR